MEGFLEQPTIVCHCLLVEASDGLVLIDTDFGIKDARKPHQLGVAFSAMMRPRPEISTTAIRQIEALGFTASDVRHVVATHLDLDHAFGLPDFPAAQVHVFGPELEVLAPHADAAYTLLMHMGVAD